LLVNHKSKHSHHSGTSVVKLDGTFLKLGRLIQLIPSEINEAVTEVTNELVLSGNILHDEKLKESDEEKDLKGSVSRNLEGASPSLSDIRELGSIEGDISRKTNSGTGGDLSEEGKLADTSVLELNETETVETALTSFIEQSQRIEEAKRGLGTELVLEGVKGGGGLAGLGRGESGGRGGKGGEDGSLHHGCEYWALRMKVSGCGGGVFVSGR
jgi:hypothetical protein